MKTLIYTLIFMTIMSYGCHRGNDNVSISTYEKSDIFHFEAKYPERRVDKLEQYLDSALKNDLPLDEDIDLLIPIGRSEEFNLKAKRGWLAITFDKKNSSLAGYLKVKQLTEGIGKKITGK